MTYPPQPPYGGQQPYGQQPYQPYGYGAQPYGQPGYPPQDHPQSTIILVLGILSLVLCSFLGPVAWVMGRRAVTEIDASGGTLGGRGQAQAGYICGIIATVLLGLGIALFVILLAVGAFASSSTSS